MTASRFRYHATVALVLVACGSGAGSVPMPTGQAAVAGMSLPARHSGAVPVVASGQALPAGLAAALERETAAQPLHHGADAPDISWTQQAELTASDGTAYDEFGYSVAFSGDTALVGAMGKNGAEGAVYVFVRNGTTWTQQSELMDPCSCGYYTYFGLSVALSGNIALVGAWGANQATGVAYVYVRSGTIWTQQAELTASDGAVNDYFGRAVALSGTTALIGAWRKNSYTGAAYIFVRNGTTWSQQAELSASDGAPQDYFGKSMALSSGTALVGAIGKNSGTGAAYVFVRSGATWTQQARLTARDGRPEDHFGAAVALSGTTALVGAWCKNRYRGAAYVFVQHGSAWTQQAELAAQGGAARGFFGVSVALSGATALVGASGGNSGTGAAYVFMQNGTMWTQQAELIASDGQPLDNFGASVALNGTTALIGAWRKNSYTGAGYVFVRT